MNRTESLFYIIYRQGVIRFFFVRDPFITPELLLIVKISCKPVGSAFALSLDGFLFFLGDLFQPPTLDILLDSRWIKNIFKGHFPAATDGDKYGAEVKEQLQDADSLILDGEDVFQGSDVAGYLTQWSFIDIHDLVGCHLEDIVAPIHIFVNCPKQRGYVQERPQQINQTGIRFEERCKVGGRPENLKDQE